MIFNNCPSFLREGLWVAYNKKSLKYSVEKATGKVAQMIWIYRKELMCCRNYKKENI